MKKRLVFCMGAVILSTVLCGLIVWKHLSAPRAFSLSNCPAEWSDFPSNMVVGKIHNQISAAQQAEIVFIEVFDVAPSDYKPYQVLYDAENDVWLVFGTLGAPEGSVIFGGTPTALIRSNGEVLAVWHGK